MSAEEPSRPRRPGPLRWAWYALGGRLPEAHQTWVLYDTTTRTWALRHLARALVQMSIPALLLLALLPAPWGLRLGAALGGLILGLIFSFAYMAETAEHRAMKAGWAPGTAQRVRDENTREREETRTRRRRDDDARRAARYRARRGDQ